MQKLGKDTHSKPNGSQNQTGGHTRDVFNIADQYQNQGVSRGNRLFCVCMAVSLEISRKIMGLHEADFAKPRPPDAKSGASAHSAAQTQARPIVSQQKQLGVDLCRQLCPLRRRYAERRTGAFQLPRLRANRRA